MTHDTLATLALKLNKPNKNKAQEIIRNMFEAIELDTGYGCGDGFKDSHKDLAQLYTFFMPAPPKKSKDAFDWVAKACGKSDVRFYLNFVYVDDGRMIATDGHRCHTALTDLEPGYYHPVTRDKVDLDHSYPDYIRIISFGDLVKDYKEINIENDKIVDGEQKIKHHPITDHPHEINKKYYDDVCSFGELIEVRQKEETDPIYFLFSDDRRAVIMPKRGQIIRT